MDNQDKRNNKTAKVTFSVNEIAAIAGAIRMLSTRGRVAGMIFGLILFAFVMSVP